MEQTGLTDEDVVRVLNDARTTIWAVNGGENNMRKITIEPVLNGWIAHVGCQRVVFTDKSAMLKALSEYCDKPTETERRWRSKGVNRWLVADMAEASEPPAGAEHIASVPAHMLRH